MNLQSLHIAPSHPMRSFAREMGIRAAIGLLLSAFAVVVAPAQQEQSGQLPEGPGKEALMRICNACHGAQIVAGRGYTSDGWTQVVLNMIQRGAQGSDEDFAAIVDYLSKNFPPKSESSSQNNATATPAKVNVNKAGPDELQKGLGLTGKEAQAIVSYREKNGDFKTLEQLKKVPDVDGAKIDAKKDSITF
jgi:competence protein ComEA